MNNTLNTPEKSENSNLESLTPKEVLDILEEASINAKEVLESTPASELNQQTSQLLQRLNQLDQNITNAEQAIDITLKSTVDSVTDDQITDITKLLKHSNNKDVLLPHFTDIFGKPESEMDTLIDQLLTNEDINNLASYHQEIEASKSQINRSLEQVFQQQSTQRERYDFKKEFQSKTGILLDQNLSAKLNIQYENSRGETKDMPLEILEIMKNKNGGYTAEIEYNDPNSNQTLKKFIDLDNLRNLLYASRAINTGLTSQNIDKRLGVNEYGLSYLDTTVEFFDQTNLNEIEVTFNGDKVRLSKSVEFHGEYTKELSISDYAKWALQSKAFPKISAQEFSTILKALNTKNSKISLANPDSNNAESSQEIQLANGLTFKSALNESDLIIESHDDKTVSYKLNDTPLQTTYGQLLSLLDREIFIHNPNSEGSQLDNFHESNIDASGVSANLTDEVNEADEGKEAKLDNNKNSKLVYGGSMPSISGLLGKVATLNGNIVWLSYSDSKTVILQIVENIKQNLKISNERKIGRNFKGAPLIGEDMARKESAAKAEIREDHKKYLERLGDWPTWQELSYQETDPIKFFATCSLLQEKGYLPVNKPEFISRVNYFINQFGIGMTNIPAPDGKNEAEIQELLIEAFDKLSEEKGTGISIIEGNNSNKQSAINKFKSQSAETFEKQPNFGMCKLHKLLQKFNETDETVDPHEVKGMILAAIQSGNIGAHELIHYLGMSAGLERNGRSLITDFGFLNDFKKAFVPATLFMNPPQLEEIKHFYKSKFSSYKFQELKNMDLKLHERLPDNLLSQLNAFSYLTNTMQRASDKSDEAIEEGVLHDDHGFYSLYTVSHNKFHNSYLFQSQTTRMYRALTAKNGKNALTAFDNYLKGFHNLNKNGSLKLSKNKGLYKDPNVFLINAMKNYISLEAGLSQRYAKSNLSSPSVGEYKSGEQKSIEVSKGIIRNVLYNANVDSGLINQILNSSDLSPQALYQAIEKAFTNVNAKHLEDALNSNFK